MPMTHNELLNAIIDDGIHEVETNYLKPEQKAKREGAIAGFNECRGKTGEEILDLHNKLKTIRLSDTNTGIKIPVRNPVWLVYEKGSADRHWCFRYFELQIEWVLNVLSAARYNEGLNTLVPVTARGLNKAIDILGVKETM